MFLKIMKNWFFGIWDIWDYWLCLVDWVTSLVGALITLVTLGW